MLLWRLQVGQALSARPDLLPKPYLEALAQLQDQLPPFDTATALALIHEDLGAPVRAVPLAVMRNDRQLANDMLQRSSDSSWKAVLHELYINTFLQGVFIQERSTHVLSEAVLSISRSLCRQQRYTASSL